MSDLRTFVKLRSSVDYSLNCSVLHKITDRRWDAVYVLMSKEDSGVERVEFRLFILVEKITAKLFLLFE